MYKNNTPPPLHIGTYSAIPINRAAHNKSVGYYIGLFGYYIKIYSILLIKIFEKFPTQLKISCTVIRDRRVLIYWAMGVYTNQVNKWGEGVTQIFTYLITTLSESERRVKNVPTFPKWFCFILGKKQTLGNLIFNTLKKLNKNLYFRSWCGIEQIMEEI